MSYENCKGDCRTCKLSDCWATKKVEAAEEKYITENYENATEIIEESNLYANFRKCENAKGANLKVDKLKLKKLLLKKMTYKEMGLKLNRNDTNLWTILHRGEKMRVSTLENFCNLINLDSKEVIL